MHEPWEEGWKPVLAPRADIARKLAAAAVLALASAGFVATVLWPLLAVLR